MRLRGEEGLRLRDVEALGRACMGLQPVIALAQRVPSITLARRARPDVGGGAENVRIHRRPNDALGELELLGGSGASSASRRGLEGAPLYLPVPLNSFFLAPSGEGASFIWGEAGGVERSRRKLGLAPGRSSLLALW